VESTTRSEDNYSKSEAEAKKVEDFVEKEDRRTPEVKVESPGRSEDLKKKEAEAKLKATEYKSPFAADNQGSGGVLGVNPFIGRLAAIAQKEEEKEGQS
jgi:hypothetical protein